MNELKKKYREKIPQELNEEYKAAIQKAKEITSLDCDKCDCDWSGMKCDYFGRGIDEVKMLLEIIENQEENIFKLQKIIQDMEFDIKHFRYTDL